MRSVAVYSGVGACCYCLLSVTHGCVLISVVVFCAFCNMQGAWVVQKIN